MYSKILVGRSEEGSHRLEAHIGPEIDSHTCNEPVPVLVAAGHNGYSAIFDPAHWDPVVNAGLWKLVENFAGLKQKAGFHWLNSISGY